MLHIGFQYMVYARDVIMICDLNSVQAAAYLNMQRVKGRCIKIGDGNKSMIVCSGRGGEVTYLSPIAARTLWQRFNRLAASVARQVTVSDCSDGGKNG